MSRHRRGGETTIAQLTTKDYYCTNTDCKKFGHAQKFGKGYCSRCQFDLVTEEEWDQAESAWQTGARPIGTTDPKLYDTGGLAVVGEAKVETDVFTCPPDLSTCPIAQGASVEVPFKLYQTWVWLAKKLDTEWLAYLTGSVKPDGTTVVEGMYFPPQLANGAHVEVDDSVTEWRPMPGTVAAIHSHVGMSACFSAEDRAHFNWPIEMVVNRDGHCMANGRTKLECGRYHRGDAKVLITQNDDNFRVLEQLKSVLKYQRAGAAPTTTQQVVSIPMSSQTAQTPERHAAPTQLVNGHAKGSDKPDVTVHGGWHMVPEVLVAKSK